MYESKDAEQVRENDADRGIHPRGAREPVLLVANRDMSTDEMARLRDDMPRNFGKVWIENSQLWHEGGPLQECASQGFTSGWILGAKYVRGKVKEALDRIKATT